MNFQARAPFLFFLAGCVVLLASCASVMRLMTPDETQIRERIASIRTAILAKDVEGIYRWGTPDWAFKGPDGKIYDRAAYRVRTAKLFARVQIESLETQVRNVTLTNEYADVWLQQTMIRIETAADGTRERWRVTYPESHQWVKVADGWHVVQVQIVSVKREQLPL